jgi:hypothetical protein
MIDGTEGLPGVGDNDDEALLHEEECPPCKGPDGGESRRRLQDMDCPPCDEEEHTPSGDDTAPHDHPDDAMNEEQGLPDMPMGDEDHVHEPDATAGEHTPAGVPDATAGDHIPAGVPDATAGNDTPAGRIMG